MTLYEHYQIEREEGRKEGIIASIDAMISKLNIPLEKACKALDVSVQEYEEAKAKQ